MQGANDNNNNTFGVNMKKFFKGCSCVGGGELDKSHSSISDTKRMLNKKQQAEFEHHSSISNVDWTDVEEIQMVPNSLGEFDFDPDQFLQLDSYETLEPIDFDSLKKVTGEEEEENKSVNSGLSKSSKKIAKNTKPTKSDARKKIPSQASPQKDKKPRGKRNPWQPHEDAKLIELVAKHGQSWSILSTLIEGRTGKQIRDRYMNILRPNVKKGDWTLEEDQQILELYYKYGHKWSKISSFVPGRTEGQVKNRFYAHIKKKILNNEEPESNGNNSPDQGAPSKKSNARSTASGMTPIQVSYSPESNHQDSMYRYTNKVNDPTDVISYSGSPGKYQRGGSDENFIDPVETETTTSSPQSKFGKVHLLPVKNENEVDDILDKVAVFFEKGISSQQIPMQGGFRNEAASAYSEPHFATSQMERMEQLRKRRENLEYLLIKTEQEMGSFNANNVNNNQNGNFGRIF